MQEHLLTEPVPPRGRPPREVPRSAGRLLLAGLACVYLATPFLVQDHILFLLSYCAVIALAGAGVVLLVGRAGTVWIAQPFFMGLGAYLAVALADRFAPGFVVVAVAAGAAAAAAGAVTGWLAVRLGGLELAIVSFGVVLIGDYLARQLTSLTGGSAGRATSSVEVSVGPVNFEDLGSFSAEQGLFWATWAVTAACLALSAFLLRRAPGRTWVALRDNERAAEAIGIDVRREKIGVFALAGAFGGLSGAMLAGLREYIAPEDFGFTMVTLLMAVVIVGGVTRLAGAVVGALALPGLEFLVSEFADSPALGWLIKSTAEDSGFFTAGSFNLLIFGALILVVLLVEPQGLLGGAARVIDTWKETAADRTVHDEGEVK
ncbi:branched-chain amino acid ABC transporter permease [Streptomyces sp. M2CJ-2]|uniref:branched-chain amino acid ABC transporter permease n=1 Tax=Streptomyces sp. M2CJ-2 TaxID=2803948 RepID=UPI001925A225|nr:branched-chain amino acid ABC transporter permease [Streptomyces sp. M2CJ-2]MBL3668044.1 branched-chain amino acid ABC transporter permease [Streptomyces sp. M2CJ-2]